MLSLKGLTSGMQVSKKSTGVFGYGAYWYWDRMSADSSVIPESLSEFYAQRALVDDSRQINLGVMGGYAYSLILPKDFFIFLSAFPGVGLNLGQLESDDNYTTPPFPGARLDAHGAIGYAGPKIYAIFSTTAFWNGVPWGDDTRSNYSHIRFKLSVGYRLTSTIGFLEKAANFLNPSEMF